MKYIISISIFVFILSACVSDEPRPGKMIQGIKTEGKQSNADIIRNPITLDGELDTINVAKIQFEETRYNFGTVNEGDIVKHLFKFKNTGKIPLIISNARSTCGCTVPVWPRAPIEPGKEGEISVRFDTKSKPNKQSKPVTITANTYPRETTIHVSGFVTPKSKN